MNGVVVDASMALSWCFEDEHDELSDRVLAAVRQGDYPAGSNLLFVMTGGLPGLFAYRSAFN